MKGEKSSKYQVDHRLRGFDAYLSLLVRCGRTILSWLLRCEKIFQAQRKMNIKADSTILFPSGTMA